MFGFALYARKCTRNFPQSAGAAAARYADWENNPRRRSQECKLAHNTYLERFLRPGDLEAVYAVRLHRTRIVQFHPDGSIVLDTGGWQTPTTRARMRECGVRVGMGAGVAGVTFGPIGCNADARNYDPDKGPSFWSNPEHAYRDGMTLRPDGSAVYADGTPAKPAEPARAVRRRELARIRRAEKRGDFSENAWLWDTRSGGRAHGGNSPEGLE
jgi:hypothetical protein